MLLDLDHFKQINDVFGHSPATTCSQPSARSSARAYATSDFGGRYGGEEFIILLPSTDRAGAVAVAESLRAELERLNVAGVTRSVTGSFGVAVLPEDGAEGEQLVRQADHALYAAKAAGRNRVHVAERSAGASTPTG